VISPEGCEPFGAFFVGSGLIQLLATGNQDCKGSWV
jgi:hypothetical protein